MKLLADFKDTFGQIKPPPELVKIVPPDDPQKGVNTVLSQGVSLIFLISTIVFVFMVLWSAYDFIFSFGEKEAIGKARQKLTWAITGFIILSLSFVIFRVIEQITGIRILLV